MRRLFILPLALLWLCAVPAWSDPPVTSKEAPSPGPEQARRWLEAMFQAPLLDYCDNSFPRSEAVRMFVALQRGDRLGPGAGWFDPSRRRHDWRWLADRFDPGRTGRIAAKDFAGPPAWFARLDRDGDGVITPDDLDWSRPSPSKEKGKGKEEKAAGKDEKGKAGKASKDVWQRCLLLGDLGSPFEGPRVDVEAPDFTLPTQDGKKQITLSDFRGKKPVVLVFGSFT
ncbi:MAG: hypothetical protein U0793_11030, partial [Gemmataceae bacterium]